MDDLIQSILAASTKQNATCMYTVEELKTFEPERLEAIYAGIVALV